MSARPSLTDIADVLVIGGGGSGLAAASQAARLGRSVILIEKNPALGGSTAWSIGSVSATNTPHQQKAGIKDSPQEHFEDLGLFAGKLASRDNPALRRLLVENTTEAFEWLLSTGLTFLGPMPESPHRYPRMHNVVPSSKAYPYHLGRHCRDLGVDMRFSTRATEFVVRQNRVVGVAAEDASGSQRTFLAKRGVVLASGDYSGSGELKSRYASDVASRAPAVNISSTGDGHRMALNIGASVVNGEIVHGPILRFRPPPKPPLTSRLPPAKLVGRIARLAFDHLPTKLLRPFLMGFVTTVLGPDPGLYRAGAILVNKHGVRFTDELAQPADDLLDQPDGEAYIILDGEIAEAFNAWPNFISTAPSVAYAYLADYRRTRRDLYREAASAEALAANLDVPATQLARTLSQGRDGRPLTKPPFVALGPIRSYVVLTDGGLKVSDRLEVLGVDDKPIDGLYAAGSSGQGGLLLYGHGHHLAWAFVSGRVAGRNAALSSEMNGPFP